MAHGGHEAGRTGDLMVALLVVEAAGEGLFDGLGLLGQLAGEIRWRNGHDPFTAAGPEVASRLLLAPVRPIKQRR